MVNYKYALKAFREYELDDRNVFANMYTEKLKDVVKTPVVPEGYLSSWAQYTLILESEEERNAIQTKLKEAGIPTMIYYPKPMHQQTVYKDYSFNLEDLKVSEMLSTTVLSLPMHPYMSEEQVNNIAEKIIKILGEIRNG